MTKAASPAAVANHRVDMSEGGSLQVDNKIDAYAYDQLGGARAERGRRGKQDECWRNPASENLFRDLAEILHPIGWDRQAGMDLR